MDVIRLRIESLMVKLSRTRDQEASCDDCARLSAVLVEALLSGNVQSDELIGILRHLEQCAPCCEEFTILQQCAEMDAKDSWPSMQELWAKLDPKM